LDVGPGDEAPLLAREQDQAADVAAPGGLVDDPLQVVEARPVEDVDLAARRVESERRQAVGADV
jgi:hypothetical protein